MHRFPVTGSRRRSGAWHARRPRLIVALGIATTIALAACGAGKPAMTGPHTITGDLTLTDATGNTANPWLHFIFSDQCETLGDWQGIVGDSAVTLSDSAGKQLGEGKLKAGKKVDDTSCRFAFTVADVPAAETYGVRITTAFDLGTFTYSTLDASGWQLHLTLKR